MPEQSEKLRGLGFSQQNYNSVPRMIPGSATREAIAELDS